MEIYSISEMVILQLKRFRNKRKIEDHIEFLLENLDLSQYLLKNIKGKYIYDLFSCQINQTDYKVDTIILIVKILKMENDKNLMIQV